MVRSLARSVLVQQGYSVLEYRDPQECLRALEETTTGADLLLSDVVMPGLNGMELFSRLSAHYPNLKVLYMSGYTDEVISSQGILNAGIEFIQKPFTIRALGNKVREILGQHRGDS